MAASAVSNSPESPSPLPAYAELSVLPADVRPSSLCTSLIYREIFPLGRKEERRGREGEREEEREGEEKPISDVLTKS